MRDDIGPPWPAPRASLLRLIFSTHFLPALFLLCALPTGICLALMTPIGQVADEPDHIARADGLLTGQILGHRMTFTDPTAHVLQTISGVNAYYGVTWASIWGLEMDGPGHTFSELNLNAHPVTPTRLSQIKALRWGGKLVPYYCPNTTQYLPFFYFPGTLGLEFGRLAGLRPFSALFVGRLMMLASFLAVGFTALVLARWGRAVLFTVLTLPMTLSLGASFNQDGQLIAVAVLFAALLTRDAAQEPRLRGFGLLLFSLFLCSKPPYGLLLFAAATPLLAPHPLRRIGLLLLFALPPALWVLLMIHVSLAPYPRPLYHPGPLWPGPRDILLHATNAADNLRVLLAHPMQILLMPLRFIGLEWRNLLYSAIGKLGWMSVTLSGWAYDGWTIAFLAALLSCLVAGQDRSWRALEAGLLLMLIAASVIAVELAIYLSWDNVGLDQIVGPMGRYYLPFLPFLIFVAPRFGQRLGLRRGIISPGQLELLLAAPALGMAFLDVIYLPMLIGRIFGG